MAGAVRLSLAWWLPGTFGNLAACLSSLTFNLPFAFQVLGVASSRKPLPSGLMMPGTSAAPLSLHCWTVMVPVWPLGR